MHKKSMYIGLLNQTVFKWNNERKNIVTIIVSVVSFTLFDTLLGDKLFSTSNVSSLGLLWKMLTSNCSRNVTGKFYES